MSCTCNQNINCNETTSCLCGIRLDVYQNGLQIDSVLFTGHDYGIPEYPIFYCFEDIAISPSPSTPCTIIFDSATQSWTFGYLNEAMNYQVPLGILRNNSSCPISSCDWETECLALLFSYGDNEYMPIYFEGQTENGYNTFIFSSNFTGIFQMYKIYFNDTTNLWTLKDLITNTDIAILDILNLSCPVGGWKDINTRVDLDIYTQLLSNSGYEFKTSAVECGCCDEYIKVTMNIQTMNSLSEIIYTAEIAKDEFGNVLALNGKPYYYFEHDGEMYFVLFDGTSWVIQTDCDEEYRITEEQDYRRTQNNNLRKLN